MSSNSWINQTKQNALKNNTSYKTTLQDYYNRAQFANSKVDTSSYTGNILPHPAKLVPMPENCSKTDKKIIENIRIKQINASAQKKK